MTTSESDKHDLNRDPVPSFPTDAEIEFAEQLRHRIEERYLGPSAIGTVHPGHSDDRH